jgi:DNA-binding response OmpR family regulator
MAHTANQTILLVEDHTPLAQTVGEYLEASGFAVDYAADGLTAMHLAVTQPFSAIVLDIKLPGLDGMEVCRRLRKDARLATPIIMLTARDGLSDKLAGFDAGADDYLVKPFDLPELEARLRSLIRRRGGASFQREFAVDDLLLNADTGEVHRHGKRVRLSPKQFDILHLLMREAPRVVSREAIEREVWGDEPPDSDALRSHLYALRKAIDKPFAAELIETIPGRGFRIRAPSTGGHDGPAPS